MCIACSSTYPLQRTCNESATDRILRHWKKRHQLPDGFPESHPWSIGSKRAMSTSGVVATGACLRLAGAAGMLERMSDVTLMLHAAASGDRQAAADLLPIVYDELRRLAAAKMAHEKPGQTLDATGLVHEAYLRLVGD